ncbi:MAG TPA: NTP transferase domain-containing protein [Thermoanaerobaculia bacterium]|nr:NTP transferase domain-containing protein [Thermoanaerobaculia bacterium]
MHELQRIHDAVARLLESGRRGLLVTVVATRGSTYRKAGARSVIGDDGSVTGAISGGCVERDLALRFEADPHSFQPRLVTYDSSSADDVVFGLGLGCRGSVDLLAQPFDAAHPPALPPVPDREPVQHNTTFEGRALLVETIRPQRRVAIFGRGPDVDPVHTMAAAVGWEVDVIRTRELPDLDRYDAIVGMTHNFLHDAEIVEAALRSRAAYIGLLGPKRRGQEILTQIPGSSSTRLHNPIGLDLGGETPEEIALCIVAEIQSVFHQRDAQPLRAKTTPIHPHTVAVVLAAGASTRLGTSKQLLDYHGQPLVRHAAQIALAAGCDQTIVVISAPEVAAQLRDLPVTLIQNPHAEEGIASSIRAAVQAAGPARILITLCDQPLITPDHLRALLATPSPIAATGYNNVAGAPAVFPPDLRAELLALQGDRGARAIIETHRDSVTIVPFEGARVDLDTEQDLQAAGLRRR